MPNLSSRAARLGFAVSLAGICRRRKRGSDRPSLKTLLLRHPHHETVSETGWAKGLSAHLLVSVISIGSILSQKTHTSSVRPVRLGAGTILFPHCKQRVTRSIMTSHGICSSIVLRNVGSNLAFDFDGERVDQASPDRHGGHLIQRRIQ